jgi:hypothetical protein
MWIIKKPISLCALIILLVACTPTAGNTRMVTTATLPVIKAWTTPTVKAIYQSNGGGEPRTAGYWVLWSTCGENSQAQVAAKNGGRSAGFILLDDLLQDPGIEVGNLRISTCQQGINLLSMRSFSEEDRSGDAAFHLAAQLVTAELNLAAGAESCPAAGGAVIAAQALLAQAGFNGQGNYWGKPGDDQTRQAAEQATRQLETYNTGALCR